MSPLARFYKLDESRRTTILETAVSEFAVSGFEAASLNKIIAQSGISKGSFYYYFEDKLDLLGAAVEYYLDPKALIDWELVASSKTADEFWEWISSSARQSVLISMEKPLMLGLGKTITQLPQEQLMSGSLGEFIGEAMRMLGESLTHGQQLGAIREDLPLELLLQLWMGIDATLSAWTLELWGDCTEAEQRGLIEKSLDTFRRLFEP